MYDGQPGHFPDGLFQFLRRLSRQRQHQIAGQIVKSCRCGSADGLDRLLRRVQPTQRFSWLSERDCTPKDSRFTPLSRNRRSCSGAAAAGFASIVTSVSGDRVKQSAAVSRICAICAGDSRDGVPPPK